MSSRTATPIATPLYVVTPLNPPSLANPLFSHLLIIIWRTGNEANSRALSYAVERQIDASFPCEKTGHAVCGSGVA